MTIIYLDHIGAGSGANCQAKSVVVLMTISVEYSIVITLWLVMTCGTRRS
jgi:hypothetical protein